MDVLQGDGLRADVSVAEGIVFVAANVERAVGARGDLYAADGFADTAIAIVS
jgi:hypothetical protein